MKKLVTVLLVAAMVLSLAGVAFADTFSDVADQAKAAQTAITKLSSLDIINGYPDGTFKPGANITRAEFAKIAVIAAGLKDSAEILKNTPSTFKDVKSNEWYTGWINLAASQGYIKGYPDKTFKPNANISNAEVVTVLLRVLGYDDNLPGPWPVDYIAKAGYLEVTKDVSLFDANAAATRANVSIMAAATLDQDLMYWDKDEEDFVQKSSKNTLLKENFKGAVHEDFLVNDWSINKDGIFSVNVTGKGDNPKTAAVEAADNVFTTSFDIAEATQIAGADVVPDVKNHTVDYIYDSSEKEITFIEVTSTKLKSDDLSYDVAKKELKIDGVKYDMAAAWKTNDATVNTDALLAAFVANGYFNVYINDDDDVYYVEKKASGNPKLVDDNGARKITFKNGGSVDTKDKRILVVKDGKYAEVSDIKENDVVYASGSVGGYDNYLQVFTFKATGKVEASYEKAGVLDEVRIDGEKYKVTAASEISRDNGDTFATMSTEKLKNVYGTSVKYFLAKDNSLAFIITDVDDKDSSTLYGIVTEVVNVKNVDPKYVTELKILNEKGQEVTYKLDTTEDDAKIFYNAAPTKATEVAIDTYAKFNVNEAGQIDEFVNLNFDATNIKNVTGADEDTNRVLIGGSWYFMDDKSVILNAAYTDAAGKDDKEADVEKYTDVADFFDKNASDTNPYPVWFKADGNKIEYMMVNTTISVTSDYAVVLDVYTIDKDTMVEVNIKGEVKTYKLSGTAPELNKVYKYTISNNKFSKGTEVTVAAANTDKEVTDIDAANKAIKIENTWYVIDEDTYIFDYSDYYDSGKDPIYLADLKEISKGDIVSFTIWNDPKDPKTNTLEHIFIVNNKVGTKEAIRY
ncbi:MAG: S-layer homology domain-containing protein [Bacillota bacterium]